MDGMHDLGGREGFSQIANAPYPSGFHADWEKKMLAINGILVARGVYNMDQYRHAIERMEARHYLTASYYERIFTAAATLCVEAGIVTQEELISAIGSGLRLSQRIGPGRRSDSTREFRVGDQVRIKDEHVSGHTRLPAYIRGKQGCVVAASPSYPYPDAAAHGCHDDWEPTYDVAFQSKDLWADRSNRDTVHVGVFRSYLIPV